MGQVIDVASDVSAYAEDLVRAGVGTVIRYYNRSNSAALPSKRLEAAEARALTEAGLWLAVVFQQRGGAGGNLSDLTGASGVRDAEKALELAAGLGQPKGSAIYFAVDHDFYKASELDAVTTYFEGVRKALDGVYRVGVYGSGAVGKTVSKRGFADLIWLAGATGWSGTRDMLPTNEWSLFQRDLHLTWSNGAFGYDRNVTSSISSDFGQFRLDGDSEVRLAAMPTVSPAVLFEVTARAGLRVRTGPAIEYSQIGSLKPGDIVTGMGSQGEWTKIDIQGDGAADGFAHRAYLKPVSGGFPVAPAANPAALRPVDTAFAELALGVEEVPGPGSNPRIEMYHASTQGGAATDDVSWCSSFVNYCVEQAGYVGTDSKWAMSWHDQKWGTTVTTNPVEGDIAVFCRRVGGSSGKIEGGHVGFWLADQGAGILLLGGNQSNRVKKSVYPKGGMMGDYHYTLLSIRRPG